MIGLAGGIASGKSTVARILEELGAGIIDSDELVHEELADAEVVATFRRWWGDKVSAPEGGIDRRAMGDVVFEDAEERSRMESFLYPRLERRRREMMEQYERDGAVRAVVVNAPLLYEVGLDRICDVVIFTECDRSRRVRRAKEQRGWDEQEMVRRENLQKSLDSKARAADYRVVNNSTVEALRAQVKPLFECILASRDGQATVGCNG